MVHRKGGGGWCTKREDVHRESGGKERMTHREKGTKKRTVHMEGGEKTCPQMVLLCNKCPPPCSFGYYITQIAF